MSSLYTCHPHNFARIASYVITEKDVIIKRIFEKKQCYFYDACSLRRHAHLKIEESRYLLEYIKQNDGVVVITRCILMELASHSGFLNEEYINYIEIINQWGIDILLIYEEDIFDVMEVCYGTNSVINDYLSWSVRMMRCPVSTITDVLEQSRYLNEILIKGKKSNSSDLYQCFFETVRNNKETGDNLGEELLAICLHILSYLPGEDDGKFCVITDDKGAAVKIDSIFKKTNKQFAGKKIGILSTPKLVQMLFNENILENRKHMKAILDIIGNTENIVVLGTQIYDLRNHDISISSDELVDLIIKPNGINIIF